MYGYHQFGMDEDHSNFQQQIVPEGETTEMEKSTPYGLPFGKVSVPARRHNTTEFTEDSSFPVVQGKVNNSSMNTVDRLLLMIDDQLSSQSRSSPLTAKEQHYSRLCPSVQGLPHPSELRSKKRKEEASFKGQKDVVFSHMQQLHRKQNEVLGKSLAKTNTPSTTTTPEWDGTPVCVSVRRTESAKPTASSDREVPGREVINFDESDDEQDMIFQPKLMKLTKATGTSCRWWQSFYAEE